MQAQTAATPGTAPPVLSLRGITKSFPGVRALSDVRLDLFPGEVTALIGENGAGKSTLVAHLMQTVAFSLGYLAGLQHSAADIAPELKAGIDASLIGREWPRIAALLAGAAAGEGDARALQMSMLATRIMAVLGSMGLHARTGDDGTVWMDVAATLH